MSNRKAEIYQGAPCRRGHNGIRYVSFGGCVECSAGMARGEYEGEIVKRRRYTDAERWMVKPMRLSGMTAPQIADAIPGMSVGQVEGLFRTLNVAPSAPRKKVSNPGSYKLKYSPEMYARIEVLHATGMSIRAIGRDVGVSHNVVQGHINRNRAKFAKRGSPIIYSDTPKPPPPPPPVESWMRTLPALPSLIGHVELAPMAPWLEQVA